MSDKELTGCVYCATNTKNNKVYVGMTTRTLEQRKKEHIRDSKKPKYIFHRAIKKHGIESFSWEVLYESKSQKELLARESQEILDRQSKQHEYGYNMTVDEEIISRGTLRHIAINKVQAMVDKYDELIILNREAHNSIVEGSIAMKKGFEEYTLLPIQLLIECIRNKKNYAKIINYMEQGNAPRYKNIFGKIEAVYG